MRFVKWIVILAIFLATLLRAQPYLVITEEGRYVREIDISTWQPGENFVNLFIDKGSYQPYLWQGEDSLDYRVTYDSLYVFGKLVGLNLAWMEPAEISNRDQIQYLSIAPDRLSALQDFPNLVAVEIGSAPDDELELDLSPLSDVKNLRALFLLKGEITDEAMEVISGLSELRVLDLKIAFMPEGGGLAPLKRLSKLHTLILPHYPLEEEVLSLSGLKNLKHLTSYYTVIDTEFVELFNTLPRLQELTVIQAEIADPILAYFAETNQLEALNLPNAGIYGDKIAYIGRMTNLTALDLSGTEVADDDMAHLVGLANLETLYLSPMYNLTDAGVKHIAEMKNLSKLSLSPENADRASAHLSGLTGITELRFTSHDLTDAGLSDLVSLSNLKVLYLESPIISDEGLRHLRALPNLRYLDVTGTGVTEEGIAALAESLPRCRIVKRY